MRIKQNLSSTRAHRRNRRSHQSIYKKPGGRVESFLFLYLCVLFAFMFPFQGVSLAATYVSGTITQDTTWTLAGSPYIVTNVVTVRSSNPNGPTVTLTIEPGVEVRFWYYSGEMITGLYIGDGGGEGGDFYYGALFAQGTEESPIIFTSNEVSPFPGYWEGIQFRGETVESSIMEHCVVEYGGGVYATNWNVYCYHASPTIRNCTIRLSSGDGIYLIDSSATIEGNNITDNSRRGIYANGTASEGATISCNTLMNNRYGVYTSNNAQTLIQNNNFVSNTEYGVYNESSATVNAMNNWWGDVNGPGYSGDDVSGAVDYTPWLTAESGCAPALPENNPPYAPNNPNPADGKVGVSIGTGEYDGYVYLSWSGGDPDEGDTVTYDVYLGTGEIFPKVAENMSDTSCWATLGEGIEEDTNYYWYVTARDSGGLETSSSTWQFTTATPNSPPFDPSNSSPGDGAVEVPLINGSVSLSWAGGDPDSGDTVVYDVYFGTAVDSLIKVGDIISETIYEKDSLAQGTNYFWQVVARDNGGLEATGPIWQFKTWASDLIVTQVTWEPLNGIEAGQEVTFTANIQNNGVGPVVDTFQVDFRIDGVSIGIKQVSQTLSNGESVQINQTWTAQVGQWLMAFQ